MFEPMIQRLQSLYLLFAALLVALFFVLGEAWREVVGTIYPWLTATTLALGGLVTLLALVSIFFYKDRQNQARVVRVAQGLDLALVGVLAGCLVALSLNEEAGGLIPVSLYLTLLFPVAAYLFLRLAKRGIDKDIALVRSMDRLR